MILNAGLHADIKTTMMISSAKIGTERVACITDWDVLNSGAGSLPELLGIVTLDVIERTEGLDDLYRKIEESA